MLCCPLRGLPRNGVYARGEIPKNVTAGTEVTYACKKGFQMLGRNRRVCLANGRWHPEGLPYCVADVAATKAVYSSQPRSDPKLAMDGNRTTCGVTLSHLSPWYMVDLRQALPISVVKLDLPPSSVAVSVMVRVGNSSTAFQNSVCNVFKGNVKPGRSLYLPCVSADSGRFVSVHINEFGSLSICEIAVYSEIVDVEDSEVTTVRSSDPPNEPPRPRGSALGLKGLTGIGLGVFVLLAPICCCCWCQRCTKCCYKKARINRALTGVENNVFVLCEHPMSHMYANSWNDLGRDGTVPTGAKGATAKLKDVRVLSPADSFSDVDLSSP
ncbi:hypothetical protein HPB52_001451 [Rhipicephalus sanguineus]|uniref:Sushi domain-containing protein n=2 Tax=Rhipicephalus sanguineus TaxID=34632 RepID=A0A9D4T8A0_RHISA|nr:hypothetical protein HPB52_001451 [Rhipicephalus sanguineus]